MKKIVLAFIIFIQITPLFAQTNLFVTARSGLNVRENSSLDAKKTGKFNYAEKVTVLTKTDLFFEVTDDGKKIKGQWYKVTGNSDSNEELTGYVFSGFLSKPKQKDTFNFLHYNDNFDYPVIATSKGSSFHGFINTEEGRSYLKGDSIEIEWKTGVIYIAGEGDRKELVDFIIASKKIKNGKIANFRETYKKEIKYTYTNSYTEDYLNKLYLEVENYIVNSNNELIKKIIKDKEQLGYTIEEKTVDGEDIITVIGIYKSFEGKTTTVQWLSYYPEFPKLYEIDS
ncbi:SH3 domain-containing protein [Cellulophaga fucicola]|uniref:SH3 domain-containing protein n=1 Tax=Cellulophaga fucicola TaxID=76595 RepID=A0A1K1QK83_9FLAO|nr:SH3 domain-containing protein [Cellulophaga fucicola]SFW60359.1 SH3 domain-containing protein [Cellulophaga fucicola]